MRPLLSLASLIIIILALPALALARDWHVASGASGDGSDGAPFGSVQDALDAAQPGDVVLIRAGSYGESLQTQRDGELAAPITLRAAPGADVEITSAGRVLRVDHAHHHFEGLRFDGQYGDRDALDINDGADGLVLRGCEVLRSSRDCVDMGGPSGVLIEGCLIHHCLNATDGRTDAHGVTGGPVVDLVIRDTEIHSFSGDAIQFDPGREAPGWDNITIEGCTLWLEPLPQPENGFAAGTVPGENALDTKTFQDGVRSRLVVRDTIAYGYRDGLISNMAAFNLKEEIDATLDGVTVYDSEIAFRLRGVTSRPGAWARVTNAVVYDVDVAVRYEDDIEAGRMLLDNCTFGLDVGSAFDRASAPQDILQVRNLLLRADALPSEATGAGNLAAAVEVFEDAAAANYHLAAGSTPINAGVTIADLLFDRDGVARPQGGAYDVGAYEALLTAQDGGVSTDSAVATDGAAAIDSAIPADGAAGATDANNLADAGAAGGDAAQQVEAGAQTDASSEPDAVAQGCGCGVTSGLPAAHGALLSALALAYLALRRRNPSSVFRRP